MLAGREDGKNAAKFTAEELTRLKLERYDADHGRPVGPAIREFGSEEGSAEVLAVDPMALTVPLHHRKATAASRDHEKAASPGTLKPRATSRRHRC